MTDTTQASLGALVFLLLTAILVTAVIWLGHMRYMLG